MFSMNLGYSIELKEANLSPSGKDLELVMKHFLKTWNFDVWWFENISNKIAFIEIG